MLSKKELLTSLIGQKVGFSFYGSGVLIYPQDKEGIVWHILEDVGTDLVKFKTYMSNDSVLLETYYWSMSNIIRITTKT